MDDLEVIEKFIDMLKGLEDTLESSRQDFAQQSQQIENRITLAHSDLVRFRDSLNAFLEEYRKLAAKGGS